jgi:hypothetical protein
MGAARTFDRRFESRRTHIVDELAIKLNVDEVTSTLAASDRGNSAAPCAPI